jgi:tetratricopeptide (TPR) repeat protein
MTPVNPEIFRVAIEHWEAGRYRVAEEVLSTELALNKGLLTVRDEAELRIKLGYMLKYQDQFARARAELECVLLLPRLPADLEERAWATVVSIYSEMGLLKRVEELAGDNASRLAHLTLTYFRAGRAEEGHATAHRVFALAEQSGDRARVLIMRSELAMWQAISPGKSGLTDEVRAASLAELDTCEVELAQIDTDIAQRAAHRIHDFRPTVQNAGAFGGAVDALRTDAANAQSTAARAMALRLLAVALLDRGDVDSLAEARGLIDEIFAILIEIEPPRGLAAAAYMAALIERGCGRLERRPELFRSALAWLEHADRWLSLGRVDHREPTMEATDEARRALNVDARRIHTLAIEIAMKDLQSVEEGFDWVERSKGTVLAEIAGTSSLPAPVTLDAADLAAEANALHELAIAASHTDAWAAQFELRRVWDRMEEMPEGAEYVALRRGTPMKHDDVSRMLTGASGEAKRRIVLIEYAVKGDQLLAFGLASNDSTVAAWLLPVSVAAIEREMHHAFDDPENIALKPLLAQPAVAACIEPILSSTDPEDIVCIVPAGPLFRLPFHAVSVNGASLMHRNPVFYAPSATTLRSCMARPYGGGNSGDAAVFGDPTNDLPDARREAAAIAQLLQVAPAIGDDATADAILRAMVMKKIVHYCGHAFFDPADPFASGLCAARDEIVAARDFLRSSGAVNLITLSGCSTGVNDVRLGDELLGFARALLYAGTASLLVTLWPIEDKAAMALMTSFYERWLVHGETKVEALRGAQHDAIRAGFTDPAQWGPFTLIGDWR